MPCLPFSLSPCIEMPVEAIGKRLYKPVPTTPFIALSLYRFIVPAPKR